VVQAFNGKRQRDDGHIACSSDDVLALVRLFADADSVRIHAPTDFRNQMSSDYEMELWKDKPKRGLGYFVFPQADSGHQPFKHAYYPPLTDAHVTNWMGVRMGTILSAHVYSCNNGARIVSMRVQGTNGATYCGRASWDNGTCIGLRRMKS